MIAKKLAGEKATEFIRDGMVIGLGTGSTAYYTIMKVGEMVKEGLQIRAVSTSNVTYDMATKLKIPMVSLDDVDQIDLTIDGADEIDPQGNGIKGGGGALLFEKIVASHSKMNIWVVDESKLVDQLGAFPLPVEVVRFGEKHIQHEFEVLGLNPRMRMIGNSPFTTDSGNYIIDLYMGKITDPRVLDHKLKQIPGVIEHGLFQGIVDKLVVGKDNGTRIIEFGNT
ncbi:MAG: ribose-5-phosphate isomerase RpiA [Bacteroidales bacterium]|nr:ribose-5-phosphate isomerase RpiA [Bacteroidales bacterium]